MRQVFKAFVDNFKNTKQVATCFSNVAAKYDYLMK